MVRTPDVHNDRSRRGNWRIASHLSYLIMVLIARNRKGEKLAEIKDQNAGLLVRLLANQRLLKYCASIEKIERAKYAVYWSPITRRRYKVKEEEMNSFAPVEGALFFVGWRYYGELLTTRIKPAIM